MQHHQRSHRGTSAITLLAAALGAVAPAAASARTIAVRGTWQQLINCVPTSYNPLTRQLTCIGSTLWQGTWNGTTHYTYQGSYDLIPGDGQGTIHELFRGKAADGTSGTLSFIEHAALNGAQGTIHIDAKIVAGTGGFAGSTGSVAFDGTDDAATGSGTYAGTWRHPADASHNATARQPSSTSRRPRAHSNRHTRSRDTGHAARGRQRHRAGDRARWAAHHERDRYDLGRIR